MSNKLVPATNELMIYLLKEDYQLLVANLGSNVFRPSRTSIQMFFSDKYPVDITKLRMYYIRNIVKDYDYFYKEGIEEILVDMSDVII